MRLTKLRSLPNQRHSIARRCPRFFASDRCSAVDWGHIPSPTRFKILCGLQSLWPRLLHRTLSLTSCRNHAGKTFVVKSVRGHPRVENERDVLRRFQDRTPHIRPMIDEIEDPAEPTTIVLRHLDDHLLQASIEKTLSRKEIKYVSKRVLQALSVLHEDGYVHSGR